METRRMGVGGQGVQNQNGVAFLPVQPAVGFVRQRDGRKCPARLQKQSAGFLAESEVLRLNDADTVFLIHKSYPLNDTLPCC
jgi:hypothetical protein